VDLEADVANQANVVAPVGFVVQPPRSVAVSDGDAIHDRLDPCALADDLDNMIVGRVSSVQAVFMSYTSRRLR
jgi:hypothetical protein